MTDSLESIRQQLLETFDDATTELSLMEQREFFIFAGAEALRLTPRNWQEEAV